MHRNQRSARSNRTDARTRQIPALLAATLLLTGLLAPAGTAGASTRGHSTAGLWVHVHVEEEGGATVRLNLPVGLVEMAAAVLPDAHVNGRIEIDDEDFTVAELRAMWGSLRAGGDALYIDADDDGDHVRVRRSHGYLLVDVDDHGRHHHRHHGDHAKVAMRIPESVIEALLAGSDDDGLDVGGALRALAAAGEGELVAVADDDARVRVWVDGVSDSR